MNIESFYGTLLLEFNKYSLIKRHLSKMAERMLEGIIAQENIIYKEVNNYHPKYLGISIEELKTINYTIDDCRSTIANEYGFQNWKTVSQSNIRYDVVFEKAVNQLINGDFDALKRTIHAHPHIISKRSNYGHQATLLHYTASNGVEMWRQKAPKNLPMITDFLINKGANVNAKMKVYGGYYDTLSLLKSSIHPFNAGIADEMIIILEKAM
ncbi:hypothetical protein [uncultured Aquimarina sp.]|uniref:hypothetical protein n=1 Tax=uncultured Aquimarina sp. TaxID=575652 RepID=UPI002628FA0A|nr:hypothetical protein [uncultured Aquimarina sp.]